MASRRLTQGQATQTQRLGSRQRAGVRCPKRRAGVRLLPRHHKGPSVCANGLTIGEARLTDAVVAALRSYFASPATSGGT